MPIPLNQPISVDECPCIEMRDGSLHCLPLVIKKEAAPRSVRGTDPRSALSSDARPAERENSSDQFIVNLYAARQR